MAKSSFREELEQKATRAILIRSIYRWESAAVIAFVMILLTAAYLLSGGWQPWHWLLLGVGALGEVGLVWSSLKDPEFRAKAVAEMFREKFNARQIKNDALRRRVEKALEYRDRIDEVIAGSREGVLRDHMADASQGITNWMENVFRLAKRLDAYMGDEMLRQDLQSVDPEIEKLKVRLGREDSDEVKRQISQTIAQKQIQRDNLRKLQNVMERAQFQLESTITAMGTVYSQMMILGSRDVASGRAQRLQQDITDQVQALQDVVHTMDEVYQVGTDPLALDLSGVDLAALDALDAGGQVTKKGTGGS
jgi:hypothetical protein